MAENFAIFSKTNLKISQRFIRRGSVEQISLESRAKHALPRYLVEERGQKGPVLAERKADYTLVSRQYPLQTIEAHTAGQAAASHSNATEGLVGLGLLVIVPGADGSVPAHTQGPSVLLHR